MAAQEPGILLRREGVVAGVVPICIELHINIGTGSGDEEDQRIQDAFEAVLKLTLAGNTRVIQSDTLKKMFESLKEALTQGTRRILRVFRGSIVLVMECPGVNSLLDLNQNTANLSQLIVEICNDPGFGSFNAPDLQVSVQVKEVSESVQMAQPPLPAQQPTPAPQKPIQFQHPAAAAAVAATPTEGQQRLKQKCESIKDQMIKEFEADNPRLLGPQGLGGSGVDVMMVAYLRKWNIIEHGKLQDITTEKTKTQQAAKLLELLLQRSAKDFIMFARILERIGMKHQLTCLEMDQNAWIFEKTDDEMDTYLDSIYVTKESFESIRAAMVAEIKESKLGQDALDAEFDVNVQKELMTLNLPYKRGMQVQHLMEHPDSLTGPDAILLLRALKNHKKWNQLKCLTNDDYAFIHRYPIDQVSNLLSNAYPRWPYSSKLVLLEDGGKSYQGQHFGH